MHHQWRWGETMSDNSDTCRTETEQETTVTQTCGRCGKQEDGPWVACSRCGYIPPEERATEMGMNYGDSDE